jgi:2-oxoacid:acceptor oxidoreductase gamma subunit (pyruvate/2-ketoisovalerate family)
MSATMLEVRIHGRGGQGAQVACQILAGAFFRSGRYVQAFAAYGGERRGAPVTAYLRADTRPIRLRCDIERPRYALLLDSTMLAESPIVSGMEPGGVLVVNAPSAVGLALGSGLRAVTVDAAAIAQRASLGPIVSTAVLGAFAGATGLVSLDDLAAAVEEGSPGRKRENIEACTAAYREAAGLQVAGERP